MIADTNRLTVSTTQPTRKPSKKPSHQVRPSDTLARAAKQIDALAENTIHPDSRKRLETIATQVLSLLLALRRASH